MAVRDQPGPRADDPHQLGVVLDDAPARSSRGALRVGIALLLLAGLVGTVSWQLAGEDKVAARPAAEAAVPGPAGRHSALAVSVRAPARVVAGQPARFVVSYTDGEGIFSGGVEDWGDGVGVGSVRLAACDASPPAAAPLRASYVATHTWSTAASYPTSFAVTTYTCRDGRATEELRSVPLAVVVEAR